jgi:ADP-ribose pyrophosphatase
MGEESWRTLGREYVYQSPWCAFRVDEVELPGGAQIEYGVLESGGFASVVPVTGGGDVVLVRQWRQPLGAFTLELPSGVVDAGEKPERTARRELFEETGYRAERLEPLASVHTSTGRSTEVCIRVVELPFGEALQRVSEGGITDAATVLGLLWSAGGAGAGGRLH